MQVDKITFDRWMNELLKAWQLS